MFRKLTVSIIAMLVSLMAVEILLQLIRPKSIDMGLWFSGSIHEPDQRFGFAFARNYRGAMRHPDGVFYTPLHLGPDGTRALARNATEAGVAHRVDIIGGASMMFSYGLPDTRSIAGRLATHHSPGLEVATVAFPGFDFFRSWLFYSERYAGNGKHPDLAVFAIYDRKLPEISQDLRTLPENCTARLFALHEGNVRYPRGRWAAFFGRAYYTFFLANKLALFLDENSILQAALPKPVYCPETVADKSPDAVSEENLRMRARAFFSSIDEALRRRGTKVLFVFLPKKLPRPKPSYYTALYDLLPPAAKFADLHANCKVEEDWIAAGHYGEKNADIIAGCLAREIRTALSH